MHWASRTNHSLTLTVCPYDYSQFGRVPMQRMIRPNSIPRRGTRIHRSDCDRFAVPRLDVCANGCMNIVDESLTVRWRLTRTAEQFALYKNVSERGPRREALINLADTTATSCSVTSKSSSRPTWARVSRSHAAANVWPSAFCVEWRIGYEHAIGRHRKGLEFGSDVRRRFCLFHLHRSSAFHSRIVTAQ
jgi:hypothetical protein